MLTETTKNFYPGPLMQKVIEQCKSVEEALNIFSQYYCEDQYTAQYLLGDTSGHSIIVEGEDISFNDFRIQVLTNFYQSHPELGGYPCWRYDKAIELLNENKNLNPYFAGIVLASTHQEGKYPTQYSNIYDLNNRKIYLFYYHNFEEYVTIDLRQELKRGYKSFNIP